MNMIRLIALVLSTIIIGCTEKKDDIVPLDNETIITLPVFDTLQGVWHWTLTYDAKKGLIKNDFDAKIDFIKVDNDTSIYYEMYKNEDIEKTGNFKIANTNFGRKIEPSIIPNYIATDELIFELISADTIKLYEFCMDCPIYYYVKH